MESGSPDVCSLCRSQVFQTVLRALGTSRNMAAVYALLFKCSITRSARRSSCSV
jgi:hypothetical protein